MIIRGCLKVINKIFIYSYRNGVSWWLSFCCRKKLPDLQLTSELPGFCREPATAAHCVRDGGKPVQSANVWRFWPAQISCCPQPKQSYPHCRPRNPRGTVCECYVRALHTVLLLEYGVSLCFNVLFFRYYQPTNKPAHCLSAPPVSWLEKSFPLC